MADTVEIIFRTKAELEGAKAIQRELENTRGKLLALGKDTKEVDAQLSQVNATLGKAGVGPGGREPFEKLTTHGKEFKHILHEIGQESPLVGAALRLAISPIAAGLGLATLAIRAFKDAFEQMSNSLKPGGGFAELKERIEASEQALRKHEDAIKAVNAALVAGSSEVVKQTKAFDEQTAAIERNAEIRDKVLAAQDRLKRLQIEEARDKGIMSSGDAYLALNKLDAEAQARSAQLKRQDQEAAIARDQARLDALNSQKPSLQLQFATASDRVDTLLSQGASPEQRAAALEADKKNLKAAQDQLAAMVARFDDLQKGLFGGRFSSGIADEEEKKNLAQTIPRARDLVEEMQETLAARENADPNQAHDWEEAQTELTRTKTNLTDNTDALRKLTEVLERKLGELDADKQLDEQLKPLNDPAKEYEERAAIRRAQEMEEKEARQAAREGGGDEGAAEDAAMEYVNQGYSVVDAVTKAAREQGIKNQQELVQLMESLGDMFTDSADGLNSTIKQIQSQVDQLGSQVENQRSQNW
jgi:ribosomal protein S16